MWYKVDHRDSQHPIVKLSEVPSEAWSGAFNAYVGRHGIKSTFVLTETDIQITLLPKGVTYEDVSAFLGQAISRAGLETSPGFERSEALLRERLSQHSRSK